MSTVHSSTQFLPPAPLREVENLQWIKEYSQENQISLRIFQEKATCRLLYAAYSFKDQTYLPLSEFLEVEGLPCFTDTENLSSALRDTFAKIREFEPGQYKISVFQRGVGGGWKEMAAGSVVAIGGIGVAVVYGPLLVGAVGSSALMSAGVSMVSTGWSREEDCFDGEFAEEALKGAVSGAVTGLIGGGVGGAIVKRAGASTVFVKQSIHAVTNAAGGAVKNVVESKTEEYLAKDDQAKARAREKLSTRNLIASAAGGVVGGIAGGHVGKHAAKISGNVTRAVATSLGGAAAGGAAGAAAGVGAAIVVNKVKGREATEGVWDAAKNGGSTGMIIGAAAASRVGAKHFNERFLKEQLNGFKKNGKISLNRVQADDLNAFVGEEIEKLKSTPSPNLQEAQEKIQKLQDLFKQVQSGELDKEALFALHEAGGLSQLSNPELEGLIQNEIEDQMARAAQRVPPPPPTPADAASPKEPRKSPTPSEKIEAPQPPKKKPLKSPPRERSQNKPNADTGVEAGQKTEFQNRLEKGLRKIEGELKKKIDFLNSLSKKGPLDPERARQLKNEIRLQQSLKELLGDPRKATENIFKALEKLEDNQHVLLPGGAGDQPASVLLRQGNQLFLLDGERAEQFLNEGAGAVSDLLVDQRYSGNSQGGNNSRLFDRIADRFEQIRDEYVGQVEQAMAEPPFPLGRGGAGQGFVENRFYPQELRRLQSLLDYLNGLLGDHESDELLSGRFREQHADMVDNLAYLRTL